MKVKILKDLYSALGHYAKDEIHDLEHDEEIVKNWIEQGYCELVKNKPVKKSEAGE